MKVFIRENKVIARDEFSGDEVFEGSLESSAEAIQVAIDRAEESGGGEVHLSGGVFPLSQMLRLKSRVLLRGSGRGTVLLVSDEHEEECGLLADTLNEAKISNLSIEGSSKSRVGIILDHCGDCEIESVTVKSFQEYGIYLRNSCFLCKVTSCSVANNGIANIYVYRMLKGRGGHYVPNTISNCMLYGGESGVKADRCIVLNINACSVYQTNGHGFHIMDMSNSVLVSGCRTFQVGGNAALVEDSHEINITSNIFCWHRGDGIELRNVNWGSINGNNIIDTGVRSDPPKIALRLTNGTRGIQAVGNALFNWPEQQPLNIGIEEEDSCYKNVICDNNISYFLNRDVVAEGKESRVQNNLSENMAYAPKQSGHPAYDGSIVPLHKLWHPMGPFENDKFGNRYPDFNLETLTEFIEETSSNSAVQDLAASVEMQS